MHWQQRKIHSYFGVAYPIILNICTFHRESIMLHKNYQESSQRRSSINRLHFISCCSFMGNTFSLSRKPDAHVWWAALNSVEWGGKGKYVHQTASIIILWWRERIVRRIMLMLLIIYDHFLKSLKWQESIISRRLNVEICSVAAFFHPINRHR